MGDSTPQTGDSMLGKLGASQHRQVGCTAHVPTHGLCSLSLPVPLPASCPRRTLCAGGSGAASPSGSFPLGVEGWPWPPPASPALRLGVPSGPLISPRLSQILPVSAPSLINVKHGIANKGGILPRPFSLIHPIVQDRFRWLENSRCST